MRFSNEGLTLWYGTDDASAPADGSTQSRQGVSMTVAIQPPNPSNVLTLRYRVDQGLVRTARGFRVRTDFDRGVEYHRAAFPDLLTGERVSYVAVASCAGRSAPDPMAAAALPSSFQLAAASLPSEAENGGPPTRRSERASPNLEYLASIRVPLREPEIVGVTPGGLMVNWFWSPNEGSVIGLKGRAKVRKDGGDWMIIRRDGIGVMNVRATVETEEGAILFASYLGSCDFGENGYENFLAKRWPDVAPTRTAPRIETAHPDYLWLNRLQCVGIGEVRMRELVYTYDLYAMR